MVRKLAACRLKIFDLRFEHFLLAAPSMSQELVAKMALLIYAMYRTFNTYRCRRTKATPAVAFDSMELFLRSAPIGHHGLTGLLENVWSDGADGPPLTSRKRKR